MKTYNITILSATLVAVCALNGQTMGSIAGTVLENGVRPLSGATISYRGTGHAERSREGFMQYTRPKVFGSVQALADGTFQITGLPADQYTICAAGPLPIHISSCSWSVSDQRVSLASGQNQIGLQLSVTRGALLDITIADSTGCAAKDSKAPVYVFAGSLSQGAYLVSASAGAYHYRALVPQSTPLRVSSNHRCSFADGNGYDLLGAGLSIPAIQGESANANMSAR